MNLARALETSVSDLPQIQLRQGPPRLHANLVAREHFEDEGKIYTLVIPGGRPPHFFRLNEMQWAVVQLFDGTRMPEDVVKVADSRLGISLTVEDVRGFVDALEAEDFWYHTPQEESVALCQHLMEERHRRARKDYGDLSSIILCAFDPDAYMAWVNKHFQWIYSRWFTYWSFFMLLVAGIILGSHWREVWDDSVKFYTMTGRGFGHFVNFLAAFLVLGAVHETAHGLTCKHYGGEVRRMGVMLVYMCPCIYCDVSQAWVYGDRWERMMTVFWGVWSEIVLCTYAAVVWWLTPPGTFLHDCAYLIILAGGIFCVLVNWNPFARMDGYMLFTEYFRINDIKAVSTQWLISWIRVRIFHLPGSVRPISRLRAACYTAYALASGVTCYSLLLFFVRIVDRLAYYYTPQWAFVPAWLLALRIFRSRILKLGHFMKELYLDKKDVLRAHWKPIAAGAAALLVVGCLPLRRDTVKERFVLEPVQQAVLRAQVPGRVVAIRVGEGQQVAAGTIIASLQDLGVQAQAAKAAADYQVAEARAMNAQLRYADYARAEQERRQARTAYRMARSKEQELTVISPIAGVVVTPRVHNLLGSYLDEGDEIAEVADLSSVRARIFVPEHELNKLQTIHGVKLRMDSRWRSVDGRVIAVSPAAQPADAGLVEASAYQGIKLPEFFVVTVALANASGEFRDGMSGTAKIYGRRRSLFGILLDPVVSAAARRLW